jgi:hypothetical protein
MLTWPCRINRLMIRWKTKTWSRGKRQRVPGNAGTQGIEGTQRIAGIMIRLMIQVNSGLGIGQIRVGEVRQVREIRVVRFVGLVGFGCHVGVVIGVVVGMCVLGIVIVIDRRWRRYHRYTSSPDVILIIILRTYYCGTSAQCDRRDYSGTTLCADKILTFKRVCKDPKLI